MKIAIVLTVIGLSIIAVQLLITLFSGVASDTGNTDKLSQQTDKVICRILVGATPCVLSIVILLVDTLLTL